jgi:hypothetical protein
MKSKVIPLSLFLIVTVCAFMVIAPYSQAQDVFITLGKRTGTPNSRNNPVTVALENTVKVKGIQLAIKDAGDYLSATGCKTFGRASTLTCDVIEKQYGWTELLLYSFGGDLIEAGSGPILSINYAVKGNAPPEECFPLIVLRKARKFESKASDENNNPLTVTSLSGSFCFTEAGDEDEDEEEDDLNENSDGLDEPTEKDVSDTGSNQLSAGSSRINFSDNAIQPTASSIQKKDTANVRSGGSSLRQPSTRGTTASLQESRGSNPSATTTIVPSSSGSSPARVIVSPESLTLTSGDLITLDPQTLDEGIVVPGDYSYDITPPSPIGSTVSADGQFTAGINRSSETIEENIKVTDTSHENASTFVVISVAGIRRPSSECELSISPSSATLSSGDSVSFTVKNVGKKCSEGLYEWKVNSKIDSSINQQGIYRAGNNKDTQQVLDIVMVMDTINKVSTDVIITVAGVSSAQKNPQPSQTTGKRTYPNLLIFLTPLAILVGFLAIRKFKH